MLPPDDVTTFVMRLSSVLSIVGTSFVILTYYLFPRLRKLRYMEIVFYVAVNDFLAAIGTVFGDTTNGTPECWFQGIVTTYNFLSSIFWTDVIALQLYAIVISRNEAFEDFTYFHIFCWGFPIILTLLPLTTNTYGEADDQSGWCFIADKHNSPSWGILFWNIAAFYIWVWGSILFVIVIFIMIIVHVRSMESVPKPVIIVLQKLGLYPAVMIICWSAASIDDTEAAVVGNYTTWNGSYSLNIMGDLLPPLQGFLWALLFLLSNNTVWHLWDDLLHCRPRSAGPGLTTTVGNNLAEDRGSKRSLNASLMQVGDEMSCVDGWSTTDSSFAMNNVDFVSDRYSSFNVLDSFQSITPGIVNTMGNVNRMSAQGSSDTPISAVGLNEKI